MWDGLQLFISANLWPLVESYKFIATCVLLFVAFSVRHGIVLLVRQQSSIPTNRRYKVNLFKNIANLLILVAVVAFWSAELQNLAFSIAAFMVAIVLATREFIQCFLGYMYAVSARPFRVGDWVQLNHMSGEVVELDWAKVTLLEIDEQSSDYTGRNLYIPNSQIVTKSVVNLNFLKRYALHSFMVTLEPTANPYEVLPQLIERARVYCEPFRDVAERYKGYIERQLDTEFIEIEPVVEIVTNQYAKFQISVTLFCPSELKHELQQNITADIMQFWFAKAENQTPALENTASNYD
jgi:small-conductance mechanosensitive channel